MHLYSEVEFTLEQYATPASVMMFSAGDLANDPVGRFGLRASKPWLKAPMVSALETDM